MSRAEHHEADPVKEYVDLMTMPATWADPAMADRAIAGVRAVCRDVCPWRAACPGDVCSLYRVERAALEALDGDGHGDGEQPDDEGGS